MDGGNFVSLHLFNPPKMPNRKFLRQVADYCCAGASGTDLADIIFVLPNKRSAMFLRHYITQIFNEKVVFMPRFTTFGRFVARNSGLKEASRNDCLFTLYNSYRKVLERRGATDSIAEFDKFVFWGEMILNDFDEIDLSLADPHMLYSNLRNLRDITADYLTPAQKEVFRNYWGDTALTVNHGADTFWLHTAADGDGRPMARRFIALWEILADVYAYYTQSLSERSMASVGMQARRAVKAFADLPVEKLRGHRYVFVGHADLSVAEITIMKRLRDARAAMFFWDTASPHFFEADGGNRAMATIARHAEIFPMPADFACDPVDILPDITLTGVPSSTLQAKLAGDIVRRLHDEGALRNASDLTTAVVLPDASLLMPLMLSLPPDITAINVTMSIPFQTTAFATLFRVIVSMQIRARKRRGRWTFFFQDILELLAHPYLRLIAPEASESLRHLIHRRRLYNLFADELCRQYPDLSFIFTAVGDLKSAAEVYGYICNLIEGIRQNLAAHVQPGALALSHEIDILDALRHEVDDLKLMIERYDISMNQSTFFVMFERILAARPINLNGTPLKGLQIMGVLETRDLDFDNVVMLSMNERTFPRRDYVRTMIPNNLRYGYGLRPVEEQESYYAYYFYRLLSRAVRADLIYDTRTGNRGSGEISRYLTQLMYLHDNGNIAHNSVDMSGSNFSPRVISVQKTPEVLDELAIFTRPDGKCLSASSLKDYLDCPLKFYLSAVKGMQADDEPKEYLDAAAQGDVFHRTVERLFAPYENALIDAAAIDEMTASGRIDTILNAVISEVAMHSDTTLAPEELNAEAELVRIVVRHQVEYMLGIERANIEKDGAFTYIKGEMAVRTQWRLTPALTVNFKMKIDRLDRLEAGFLRIIDYKTGTDDTSASKIDSLFTSTSKHGLFQLMVYAEALADYIADNPESEELKQMTGLADNSLARDKLSIRIVLNSLRKIMLTGSVPEVSLPGSKNSGRQYPDEHAAFRPLLDSLIQSIFDPEKPFVQSEDDKACRFCPFTRLCGRTPSTDEQTSR